MTNSTSENIGPNVYGGPPPSFAELRAARNFVTAFLGALKNYGLYPESHKTTQRVLKNVLAHLDPFLRSYGSLRLDIDKVRLLFKGKEVHDGPSNAENPAFFLYRDGIIWLEFQRGIGHAEITALFRIINKFKILLEDPEDDLATALWSANLPHLDYDVSDELWAAEPVLEFSMISSMGNLTIFAGDSWEDGFVFGQQGGKSSLTTADRPQIPAYTPGAGMPDFGPVNNMAPHDLTTRLTEDLTAPDAKEEGAGEEKEYMAVSIAMPSIDRGLWNLSPQEQKAMQKMVEKEESREDASDVIDLLMIVLDKENDPLSFSSVMGFFHDEFRNNMYNQDFQAALDLLEKISAFRKQCTIDWAVEQIDNFFDEISEPEAMMVLMPIWSDLSFFESKKLKTFSRVLQSLPPKAGVSMAPMFSYLESAPARQVLTDVIVSFVEKDLKSLATMLEERPEVDLLLKLVKALDEIDNQKANEILLEKGLSHPSDKIRLAALDVLIDKNSPEFEKLFDLIIDENEIIRQVTLTYLGTKRSDSVAKLLREHIEEGGHSQFGSEHVIDCFRALGRSGSNTLLPFLEKVLLSSSWGKIFESHSLAHRQGAAEALAALDTDGGRLVLRKEAKSSFSPVKSLCKKLLAK